MYGSSYAWWQSCSDKWGITKSRCTVPYFAQKRFCGSEGIEQIMTVSTFRDPHALDQLGVRLVTGKLKDLAARAILVLDEQGNIIHRELVGEIANEPNYDLALSVL